MKTILSSLLDARRRTSTAARYAKNGKWQSIVWPEYYKMTEKTGAGLLDLGIKPKDKVAIFSNTRLEWATSDCAILGVGGVTIPIYQSSLPQDAAYILNNSETKVIILENQVLYDRWKQIEKDCPTVKWIVSIEPFDTKDDRVMSLTQLMERGAKKLTERSDIFIELCENVKLTDIATIVYTSGTTGMPKGVLLTHEQIMSEVEDIFHVLEITEKDTSLTFLPYAHIFGRVEHFAHVHFGFIMGYAESIDKIKQGLVEVKPTFIAAVPRIFEKLYAGVISQAEVSPTKKKIFSWAMKVGFEVSDARVQKRPVPLATMIQYQAARKLVFEKLLEKLGGRLRFAISGGAPLSKEIARFFHAAGIYILEGYGLTETTAAVFVNTPYDYRFGTVGKAVGDVQVKFLDDGEILVKSKKVMKGYYKNDEATREVLDDDGWFATGDIGELSNDGFLRITDRKKDLIKTAGGKFVAPQKLENILKLNKYVSNVLIHGDQKKYIVALITVNPDEIKKAAEELAINARDIPTLIKNQKIRELVRQAVADVNSQVASWESIKSFEILPDDFTIESGELTPSLKVKRKFCDKKYATIIDRLYE